MKIPGIFIGFLWGIALGVGVASTLRDGNKEEVMREAYKLGYAQQLVDERENVTYQWRDFHDVEKHYSELEEK